MMVIKIIVRVMIIMVTMMVIIILIIITMIFITVNEANYGKIHNGHLTALRSAILISTAYRQPHNI